MVPAHLGGIHLLSEHELGYYCQARCQGLEELGRCQKQQATRRKAPEGADERQCRDTGARPGQWVFPGLERGSLEKGKGSIWGHSSS